VLESTLSPRFLGQLKNLHKVCLVAFKKAMLDGVGREGYDFGEVSAKARVSCEEKFRAIAQEATVEGTYWTWEDELALLREEMASVGDQCRKDETKKMVNTIEVGYFSSLSSDYECRSYACTQRNFKKTISEPVDLYLNKPSPDMWDNVLKTFTQTLEKAETTYLTKAKSKPLIVHRVCDG
jgi:hypothetical protein